MITDTRPARLIRLFFMLSLLFSVCICRTTASADVVEEPAIKIGIYENEPKVFTSKAGKPAGIFIDIIEHIAKSEGWKLQYVPGTWAEGLERLEKGEIDLMPDVAFTADRGEIYSFHKEPVLSSWSQVYAKKGSGIRSILDLDGKRIATLQGSVQQEAFTRLSESFGLKITLLSAVDFKQAFAMVAINEADAAISNSFFGMLHTEKYGLEDTAVVFSPSKLLFAAPKNSPQHLLATIDRHLLEMKENSKSVYYVSLKHWTSDEVTFKIPLWLQIVGLGGLGILIMSLVGSAILKHQVGLRTRQLRTSEREYRELVMLANSIILRWSSEGLITFLNEFGRQFFGYTAEEIVGRHLVGTLVPEEDSKGRKLRPLIEELCADPRKFERNINENVRRNGERVWIDWTNKVVLDEQGKIKEILSIGSDITERKQAEEQISRLNEDLRQHAETLEQRVAERTAELAAINDEQRTIFESASTGIVLLRDRVILRCNRKLEEIAGYGHGELVGKSTRIWYPDDKAYADGGDIVYLQMARGETFRHEQQMARKDGSLFWVRLSLRAFDKNDPLKGAVGIIEDISDEFEAAENLRKAMEAAQAADRLKSAFLATMSHELRTPLNSIIGFTGIMLQGLTGPLNPEQHKQMTMVQNSSRHLLSLINDVLDISKIEAGQLVLARTSFDLGVSIDKMAKLVSPLAEKKGIALQLDLPDTPMTMTTDQRRLEQVILNLLNNAVKFTEIGSVRISCLSENDHFLISFADTGIGIEPAEIPKLFQPFHQVDTGLARKREGTGLGLSICRKIVDMMGGSIEVRSTWGQGSIFTIRLPRQAGGRV